MLQSINFYFKNNISELFYLLHYLKSLSERYYIYLYMEDYDDYLLMKPIIDKLDYIGKFEYLDKYPENPAEVNHGSWFKVTDKSLESKINNSNRIIKYYDRFETIPFDSFFSSWVPCEKPIEECKNVVISVDFKNDDKYFNYIRFYDMI